MDSVLPTNISYWMTSDSKHDCFFIVGPESGPTERIGAIRIFLLGHSEVLRKMLDESPLAEVEDIKVTDTDPETFRNFLRCVYGGTDIVVRKLSFENCLSLLYLCEKYLTLDIKEKISSLVLQLYQPLSVDNVFLALSSPACLESKTLASAITKVVQNNTDQVLNHKSFLDLDHEALLFLAKQDKISTDEITLCKAVFNWAQKRKDTTESKDLRSCLGNILQHIRFCAMDCTDFCKYVVPHDVLTPEEVVEIVKSIGASKIPKLVGLSCRIEKRQINVFLAGETKFTYVCNNIKKSSCIDETSSKFTCGCHDWNIQLYKGKDKDIFGIYLNCLTPKKSWKCLVNCTFTLVNHQGMSNLRFYMNLTEFSDENSGWGRSEFASYKDLVKNEMGYIKDNAIEIVTHLEVFLPLV